MSIRDVDTQQQEIARSNREKFVGVKHALEVSAVLAGGILARRKLAITRGISKEIVGAGLHGASRYERYLSSTAKYAAGGRRKTGRETTIEKFKGKGIEIAQAMRDLLRPLPSSQELWNISVQRHARESGFSATSFPAWEQLGMPSRPWWETIFKGPDVLAFAKGTPTGILGREGWPSKVGEHGATLIGNKLFFLRSPEEINAGGVFSDFYVPGMHATFTKSWGSNLERHRQGLIKPINPRNTKEYIKKVELNPSAIIEEETPLFLREKYFNQYFPGLGNLRGKTTAELRGIAESELSIRTAEGRHNIPTIEQFMGMQVPGSGRGSMTFRRLLLKNAAETRELIASQAAESTFAKIRFNMFKTSRKYGIGEEFTTYGGGVPQQAEKWLREGAGWNYKHPVTGKTLRVTPRRYNTAGVTLGPKWKTGEGSFYLSNAENTFFRNLSVMSTGTFHRVGEKAFGVGVSDRANAITEFFRKGIGSKKGSWSDMWIRNVGKTARILAMGTAASYAYRFSNYLSREATGVGPTDIASGAYIKAREFQQNLLNSLGVTHAAKTLEKAFPGSITSPAAQAARIFAPYFAAKFFGKKYGPKGFIAGLSAGIAFALVTWGDITQSPEELHRIFTGEQEIPVRKGRYWLLGKTPFFGGKIAYWRPHWYPLMKSRYQTQGDLWESEREYWAQGTALSPVLAPILTGQAWDPYYWEKKHYRDRPYPITGELFEPTMPFSWIANPTIGAIIKPQRIMHPEFIGAIQGNLSDRDRGVPEDVSERLGIEPFGVGGIESSTSPQSLGYQIGLGAYTQTEQMGLLGFGVNTLWNQLTGQTDFMASPAVVQSPRRATGYERAYWEKDLGDPGAGFNEGLTEYFRRFLPHRRSSADEYNPVPNNMPDWLPGEDYFINFRQGDPYIKVPYGEARLPGRGYESLHQLHSGIPGVYDAVDRLMILSNVAPYSDEYKQYKVLAKGMVREDKVWADQVEKAIAKRDALNIEYEFLSLGTEGVAEPLKPLSSAYRRALAFATNFPNPLETIPFKTLVYGVPAHINKWLPYKTGESTYEDFRMYGTEYAMWDQPIEAFAKPFLNKIRSVDEGYIPKDVQRRREIQEYFDKIKFIKYSNLSQLARKQGDIDLAKKLSKVSRKTMMSANYNPAAAMGAIPKEERSFFDEFSKAKGERRDKILQMVPSYMRNYYMSAWNKVDGEKTYDVDYQTADDMVGYFENHYLPPPEWQGWHPDVSLEQVKLRVVKNEAFDIHKFNLWESNERQLARQPLTPTIENINAPTDNLTMLQNTIVSNMEKFGMTNSRVFVSRTPASENSHRIRMNIRQDRTEDNDRAMKQTLAMR